MGTTTTTTRQGLGKARLHLLRAPNNNIAIERVCSRLNTVFPSISHAGGQ